jgi:hypothetical protein
VLITKSLKLLMDCIAQFTFKILKDLLVVVRLVFVLQASKLQALDNMSTREESQERSEFQNAFFS